MRIVRFRPSVTTFHRCTLQEMCGALPPVLYKILPATYAHRLVNAGEMQWSTLTYFQTVEDASRGDASEGSRRYFPINGLEITRLERNGRLDHATFLLPDEGMVSKAAQSDHIFVYSMTLESTLEIGESADRACVEIFDPEMFVRHVRAAIARRRSACVDTFIYNEMKYWDPETPPEEVWALPDRLTMHKHEDFVRQREYRLAFGIRKSVFDFENIEGFIVHKDYRWPILRLDLQAHRRKLRLGSLTDCCRLL